MVYNFYNGWLWMVIVMILIISKWCKCNNFSVANLFLYCLWMTCCQCLTYLYKRPQRLQNVHSFRLRLQDGYNQIMYSHLQCILNRPTRFCLSLHQISSMLLLSFYHYLLSLSFYKQPGHRTCQNDRHKLFPISLGKEFLLFLRICYFHWLVEYLRILKCKDESFSIYISLSILFSIIEMQIDNIWLLFLLNYLPGACHQYYQICQILAKCEDKKLIKTWASFLCHCFFNEQTTANVGILKVDIGTQ